MAHILGISDTILSLSPQLSEKRQKKIGETGRLTTQERSAISFVGTATPGTKKGVRRVDTAATRFLSEAGRFADIPSSGGFTVLGKNSLGQDVVRDNTTGAIRVASASGGKAGRISPEARTLGETKTSKELARKGDVRRPQTVTKSTQRKTTTLGTQSILGSQSILG